MDDYSVVMNSVGIYGRGKFIKIGSFALQENYNGAIVALEDGLYQLDFDTGNLKFICNPEPDLPQNRLNDGRVDRQGRFVLVL